MKPRLIGLTITALLALNIATTATAHEFNSSNGKTEGTIKIVGVGSQVFQTSALAITCEQLTGRGTTKSGTTKSGAVLLNFSECTTFGDAAKVTRGETLFNADLSVRVFGELFIITVAVAKCSIIILTEKGNTTLQSVQYATGTNNKTLKIVLTVEKIETEPQAAGATSLCGTSKTIDKNGSYRGKATAELEGGTLEWK